MPLDAVVIKDFYSRPLGQVARRILGAKIRARWSDVSRLKLLGVGYTTPYVGAYRGEAAATFLLMLAEQGVVPWPKDAPRKVALVEDDMWPLADEGFDRILVVHALEGAHRADELLREVWRTLAPGGRMIAVVPNRRGLWARRDTTPFGNGRPYTKSQLAELLNDTHFKPIGWGEALMMPPIERGLPLGSAVWLERLGHRMGAPFAGVHIVEAEKQVMRPIPTKAVRRVKPSLAPIPVGVLAPGRSG